VLIGTGDVLPAAEALSAHARAVEVDDRARAALMQVDAARALGVSGRIVDAERLAERAAANAVAAGRPELRAVAEAIRCLALLLLGERALADTLLPRVRALADAPHPLLAAMLHRSLLFADEFVEAEHVLERAIHRYRASGGVAALPELLGFQADLAYRLGRWDEAAMLAEEGIRLAPEFDQPMGGSGQALLARIAAARGREQEAREHIATARAVARATGAHAVRSYSDATLGLLELSLGHAEAAIEALGAAWRATESIGGLIATEVQEAPDLVEAYVAAGREREAERVLVTFEQRGIRARSRWTLAAAARCRGLLAGQGFGEHFERALALHAALPTPFEEARTELAYGERLSRAGRHDEAHDLLTRATARFELLDAAPWAARAKAPLTGGGGRERPRSQAGALTAQELRVALLVARGATNREAAHELFVTPKTIEKHLAACYQKLGVRNRTELAATMLRPPASSRARVGLEESGSPDVPPLHGEV
jgi:DNA-binding CsgD family transcriptional regulator